MSIEKAQNFSYARTLPAFDVFFRKRTILVKLPLRPHTPLVSIHTRFSGSLKPTKLVRSI
ncbi:hypothetical protein F4W05_12155 [Ewingella americana]|nr:hypothetical protein F4W05_12155 [Ewingella americana]